MLGLGAAAVLVAAGVAGAAIPDSDDGEIHACYKKDNGQLRVVDAEGGAECRPSEEPLEWNQVGPRGPSDAFARYHDGSQAITTFNDPQLELDVPAGAYAVTATVIVQNHDISDGGFVQCRTKLPSGDFDIARAGLDPGSPDTADLQTLTMNPVGYGPGTIRLACADGGGDVEASWAKITAIQVGNLTNTAG